MNRCLVCIDPGHQQGGNDPGAIYGNLKEKYFTLSISLKVADLLQYNNINVILTRYRDVYINLDNNRTPNCDISVSIHINSGGGEGLETWISLYNNHKQSERLGSLIQQNILQLVPFKNRGLKTRRNSKNNADYHYMLRNSKGIPVIVECGFIDNTRDRLLFQNNLNKIAEGIAMGICKYLGVDFKVPKKSKYFKDIPEDHWSIDYFDEAKELGLIQGEGNDISGFGKNITKEIYVTGLVNLYKKLKGEN